MWPWCQKRISSWCMFRPMTGFITIVTAHVTEGMGQNIKGIFKYCFQRRMSPNGNFHFKKALFFLTKIFLAKYFINCIQKVTRKLCWDFSVAKQVDVQWLGMWICAFLCSLHTFVCRGHLMLWPHKWRFSPGCKHLVGGGCPDGIPSRNTAVATWTLMKPQSHNCKYLHGGMNESQPSSLKM